jgi:adenylate kinase
VTSLNVLLLGIQGSGKGTQAKRIASEYGIPHIATGEILRKHIQEGTEIGKRWGPVVHSGALVPDAVLVDIVRGRLNDADTVEGFVLDGFPRTQPQAEALDTMLSHIGRPLSIILELQVPDDVARARMAKRAQDEGRADDTPEAIEKRITGYHSLSRPLVDHYFATGKLVAIHGDRPVNQVWAEIQEALDYMQRRDGDHP